MAIEFHAEPAVAELAEHTSGFVREAVLPAERECRGSVHSAPEELRLRLQAAAKQAGVFGPHIKPEWGGHGLDLRGQAVVLEAAGYSHLGPLALGGMAPDEGRILLLEESPARSTGWSTRPHRPAARSASPVTPRCLG